MDEVISRKKAQKLYDRGYAVDAYVTRDKASYWIRVTNISPKECKSASKFTIGHKHSVIANDTTGYDNYLQGQDYIDFMKVKSNLLPGDCVTIKKKAFSNIEGYKVYSKVKYLITSISGGTASSNYTSGIGSIDFDIKLLKKCKQRKPDDK